VNNNQLKDTQFFDRTEENFGWTTWLHNATLNLPIILPSNQIESSTDVILQNSIDDLFLPRYKSIETFINNMGFT